MESATNTAQVLLSTLSMITLLLLGKKKDREKHMDTGKITFT